MAELTEKYLTEQIEGKLNRYFGTTFIESSVDQLYKAMVLSIRDILLEKRKNFNKKMEKQDGKRVSYLCMEFLMGRSLKNNLYNLGLDKIAADIIEKKDLTLEDVYEKEPDAGLGNGGLGRLAACFLDALAANQYPAIGYSICYEYGLFKQKIVDGWQMELPDIWLPGGESWLVPRNDKSVRVKFDGYIEEIFENDRMVVLHRDAYEVEAVPYDMMVSGADSEAVSVLRLWKAKSVRQFDMNSFSQGDYVKAMEQNNEAELISKVLYPSDEHLEGKELRLKQQYFLVSASVQDIISDHIRRYKDIRTLPKYTAMHINDTHPALCIPELMRILLDEFAMSWEEAWDIVTRTVAYTNHTVLQEALEKWPVDLVERKLPRIYQIIKEINRRFCDEMWARFPGDWDKIQRMSILAYNQVRMANLSVVASHSVNGVSALHSEIIKKSIFKDYFDVTPQKFKNVTNGIAHRRWLCQSNPELSSLLDECIGSEYRNNAQKLKDFEKFSGDKAVLKRLADIKLHNKQRFADFMQKKQGIVMNPNSRFDVQAKRLHEYKRQLLNVMRIISLYVDLKENPSKEIPPQTFIFGAKAASSYYIAKRIIKLINFIGEDIKKDKALSEKMQVVFVEDYCVSTAELLMPATEVSQQISLAGKEASGTGNMKFMINGAITFGTMDGANVEINDAVGSDNILIFGMTTPQVNQLWNSGYNSSDFYNGSVSMKKIIDMLNFGFNGESFADIGKYLLTAQPIADPYMCLADFHSYMFMQKKLDDIYADKMLFNKISLKNIANAGIFAADRSVTEYAENIWGLKKIKK